MNCMETMQKEKETLQSSEISQPNFLEMGIQNQYETEESYEVSIVFCQYNAEWSRIEKSLASFIRQKDVHFQIVIADDGSYNNCFDKIKEYFAQNNFQDYLLIPAVVNEGTVKNVLKGIEHSTGRYIKTMSPGDCLIGEHILRDWVDNLKASGKKWSFSDVVYYFINNTGQEEHTSMNAHPQIVKPYIKKKDKECQWNYVALKDIALGAAILVERRICMSYLRLIEETVLYAEDNIYRIMMFDGHYAYYYPVCAVLYEYGSGISTGKSLIWEKRLQKDWKETDKLMRKRVKDAFQRKMAKSLYMEEVSGKTCKLMHYPKPFTYIRYKLKLIFFKRKTQR